MASQAERLQALQDSGNLPEGQLQRLGVLISSQDSIPPIPEPRLPEPRDVPEEPQPTTLPELTGGFVTRSAFEAVGGLGGGAVGVTGGPAAPLTVLAGGGLGAAGGSALFDTVEDVLRSVGVLAQPEDQKTGIERVQEVGETALKAGVTDVAFGAGGQVVLTGLRAAKPAVGKVFGVRSKEARAIAEQARSSGLLVGAAEAGGAIPKGIERVIGIFPFVSAPIRKARGRIVETAERKLDSLLNNFAPNATLSSKLSINMFNAAKGARKDFLAMSGRLYDRFRDLAKDSGDIIPTANLKAIGKAARELEEAGAISLGGQKKLAAPVRDVVNDFVKQLEKLPDSINVEQFTRLGDDLQKAFKKLAVEGVDVRALAEVKEGLEAALANIDASKATNGAEIKGALDAANRFYSQNIARFQTPTAKRFGRVDKKVFEAGRDQAGTINADEVFDVAVNLRSAEAIKDLEKLVGKDLIRAAGRKIVESAFSKHTVIKDGAAQLPRFGDIRKTLGLVGPESRVRREALQQLLGKKNLKALDDVLLVAGKIAETPAVSSFIARRATLGGAAAIGTAFTFGGSVLGGSGAVGALGLTLLARHFGKLATKPEALEQMQRVILNADVELGKRRNALLRLARTIAQSVAEDEESP
jgi:hypothetical protein